MKKQLLLLFLGFVACTCSYGQKSGIGTTVPNSSSAFEINSSTGGFLMPRMSQVQRDAIVLPEPGLMIYNTTSNCQEFYNGAWFGLCNQGSIKIITQPTAPVPTCSGAGIQILSVTAAGTNLTYTWRRNGVSVVNGGVFSGQGTSSLTLTSPTFSDVGNYEVVITDSAWALSSYNVIVSIYNTNISNTVSATACQNTAAILSAYAPEATINWYDTSTGGTSLYTGTQFTTPVLTANTTYYAEAAVAGCVSPVRSAITANVIPLPIVSATGNATLGCGVPVNASSSLSSDVISWYDAPVGGSLLFTGPIFTTPMLNATTTYYAESKNIYGCSSSSRSAAIVTVTPRESFAVVGAACKIWMAYNVGATAVPSTIADYTQYGSLYQWGRGSDGHELINWATGTPVNNSTAIKSPTDTPGNSLFITVPNGDWRLTHNDNLWQGVSGINNPCPAGFRLPTVAELTAEFTAAGITNRPTGYASSLKLPSTPYRTSVDGALLAFSTIYWTSTVSGANVSMFILQDNNFISATDPRSDGGSVRCVRE